MVEIVEYTEFHVYKSSVNKAIRYVGFVTRTNHEVYSEEFGLKLQGEDNYP